eukprot:5840352-Prymnesium_polylepis.1
MQSARVCGRRRGCGRRRPAMRWVRQVIPWWGDQGRRSVQAVGGSAGDGTEGAGSRSVRFACFFWHDSAGALLVRLSLVVPRALLRSCG